MAGMRESGYAGRAARAVIVAAVFAAMAAFIILNDGYGDSRQSELAKSGQIFLYGEAHGVEAILEEELRLWKKYYHEDGMRHLFIEAAYYDSEILNGWMQEKNDDILDDYFEGLRGTASYSGLVKDFYRKIKENCPETIFHGTDVGHQYATTGRQYLEELKAQGKEDTEEYRLATEAVGQGRYFVENTDDWEYRENKMVENFIREFDKLDGLSVMGIYGGAHTAVNGIAVGTQSLPCMANQLNEHYGGSTIQTRDLSRHLLETDIAGKTYQVLYMADFVHGHEYKYRNFTWVKDAFDDFKDSKSSGEILSEGDFPAEVREGDIYIVTDTHEDGTYEKSYYRAVKEGDRLFMEGFICEE